MPNVALTRPQLLMLRELAARDDAKNERGRWGWGSGCTNPTGKALERRGFAKVEFDRSKSCAGFPWSRWVITPKGRDWIEDNG